MAPEVLPSYGGLIPLSDTSAVNVDARPLLLAVPVWCQAHLSAILPGHVAVLKCMEDQEAQVGVIGCIEIGRSFLLPSGQMSELCGKSVCDISISIIINTIIDRSSATGQEEKYDALRVVSFFLICLSHLVLIPMRVRSPPCLVMVSTELQDREEPIIDIQTL
ncbi:hypothetical protein CBS147482_5465 [Aspergillus niger]|nr:hypothetical protein CBS11232_7092 [Aspergillus niger]KAI2872892.1 hypothetical protein CBS115988_7484 [Aspergillus niger]KAI2967106.1 hypothetical protein CBS147324_7142 [Aspergillus niger]KAI3007878.1 hypothetical protein CBS147482_5465 [Aspergillus niger]KAI3045755.1 hypothetical protein CBS147352_7578 [Aspergillus niger]